MKQSLRQEKKAEVMNKKFFMRFIPVVDTHTNMNLLFMVRTEELQLLSEKYFGVFGGAEEDIPPDDERGIELTTMQGSTDRLSG